MPYQTDEANAAHARVEKLRASERGRRRTDRMRAELHERKNAGRLPEEKAFWELVRIVFTEKPKTFLDAIRFAQAKVAIVTGFRVGENAMLPADWERWREYVDAQGRPAGDRGGISRSLMIRYFAEKQQEDEGQAGVVLYETAQHVPPMFEELVLDTLSDAARITAPLRERLRLQTETGRIFPEFSPDAVLPAWDLYTRVSGAFWFLDEAPPASLVAAYRERHEADELERLRRYQLERLPDGGVGDVKKYWGRYAREGRILLCDASGRPLKRRARWHNVHLRVRDVERLIRESMPTKLPDTLPFTLAGGANLYPHELLYLVPVRALMENRNAGIADVCRYFSIGRASPSDLRLQLGAAKDNLFTRYGETDEDKTYSIEPHALRHLQNAELFRLGVADAIITKRFGRRSVAQSYHYDHRSLAEDLAAIDLPDEAAERLGPRALEAFKLLQSGRARGPILDEFRRVQRELGEDAAFDYLDAEVDGLHATPYGFCMNSFTVDPCPKHLECFNGCRHLTRSELPEEQRNLEKMRDRMARIITKIETMPLEARSVGWRNQLRHAKIRLENIAKALASAPGSKPFPDGQDLFRSVDEKAGTSLLDRHQRGNR